MPRNALHEALEQCAWRGETLMLTAPDISTLIADNPDSLMEKDNDGFTPLFCACMHGASLEVVQVLIDACPDAVLECEVGGHLPIPCMLGAERFSHARALINANPACLKLQGGKHGLPLHVAMKTAADVETFNMILDGYPEACKVKDGYQRVPLECALNAAILPAFEVIEALVRVFPEALKFQAKDSRHGISLMHHICARYSLTDTFVLTVKDSFPEAFLSADTNGFVPLHFAWLNLELDDEDEDEAQQAGVLSMLRACPEAASVAAEDGQLPLHTSIRHLDARGITVLVEAYREAVVTRAGIRGQTPLHMLFAQPETFSLEVAKVLVAARPDVLMVKDEYGNNPLSIALQCDADLPTVEWLINARPESVQVTNDTGESPLYIAISCDTPAALELIPMLYQACPGSVKQTDADGMLPLYTAIFYGSRAIVEFLLEAYPEAANARDDEGRLPLHCAVCRIEMFDFLLEAYPEAVRIKDNQGMLPLHHAVQHGSLDTVTMLVAAWPDSLKEPTLEGDIPLLLAFERDEFDKGIVKLLLETWPDSVECTNSVGDLPIHMVSRLTDGSNDMNLSDIFARAKCLIDTWPESLLRKNPEGDLPLHVLLSCIKDAEQLGRKRKRDDTVNSQLELVHLFVSKCPESVEVGDGEGGIPLVEACDNDDVSLEVIDFLVRASMNVLLIANRRRSVAAA